MRFSTCFFPIVLVMVYDKNKWHQMMNEAWWFYLEIAHLNSINNRARHHGFLVQGWFTTENTFSALFNIFNIFSPPIYWDRTTTYNNKGSIEKYGRRPSLSFVLCFFVSLILSSFFSQNVLKNIFQYFKYFSIHFSNSVVINPLFLVQQCWIMILMAPWDLKLS